MAPETQIQITKLSSVGPQTVRENNNNNSMLLFWAIKFRMVCYISVDTRMAARVPREKRALTYLGTSCRYRIGINPHGSN